MSGHCPQDGGFIGAAGCTHPNHQHSELVKGIIVNAMPRGRLHLISEADAEAALKEVFYVNDPTGKRVGFGKGLLEHIDKCDQFSFCFFKCNYHIYLKTVRISFYP